MSITLKLGELKLIEQPLNKLVSAPLPARTSYRLSKILKKVAAELSDLEDQRVALIKKYGEENEETQSISINDPENIKIFQQEYTEVLEEEITLDFDPMSISMLGDKVEFTPSDMLLLEPLFVEDEDI